MDTKTRNIIILGSIVTFIIVPGITWMILSHFSSMPSTPQSQVQSVVTRDRTNQELMKAITTDKPVFLTNGQPNIKIVNVTHPEKRWYVVTIQQLGDSGATPPVKLLLLDYGQPSNLVKVALGPGREFPLSETAPIGVPNTVAKELNKW